VSDLLSITLAIGLIVVAGGGFILIQQQRRTVQREAFQALAARRGWSLTVSDQKLGRPGVLRLTSRAGLGWTAQTRRQAAGPQGSPAQQTTEFDADEPRWNDGLMIVGPSAPDPAPDGGSPLAALGTAEGLRWLARFMGEDVAKYGSVLTAYPAHPALTVLSTADPALRIDFGDLAKLLAAWDQPVRGDRGHPILILGPDGMRLRLRHGMARADHMERFIDLALDIGRIL
jgi:hypothetical protein